MSPGPPQDLDIAYGPDNPQTESIDQQQQQLQIPDAYKDLMVRTITIYREQWAPDRLLRLPQWMKNVLMFRGQQILGWDQGSGTYFDALAWWRKEGKQQDGADTYLEKYINNITQMLETAFVGTMSRGVPPTIVRPENAEILADVTTAKAAQEAIAIIERMNRIRQMVRIENNLLYLYGAYFKYTRAVLDGDWAGWEEQDEFGQIQVTRPDRYHCFGCGKDNPSEQFDDDNKACAGCNKPLGAESFYPSETTTEIAFKGQKRVPKAMVRWTLHGPMEIDCNPQAKTLEDTPILSFDQEVDIGSLRLTFPGMAEQITEGAEVGTTPNASYEKLRRSEVYSMGWGYTSDSQNQQATYSQNWMQPTSYWRLGDKAFANWMLDNFPRGCKVSLVGTKVVDIREAALTKEWSCCLLHENVGLYPPAIADNVVPFNERFNDTMNIIDDWIERCAAGMTIYDRSKIDSREMSGRSMANGVLNGIQTKGSGIDKPLADSIFQFKFALDPQIFSYPGMLLNFCELISGVTPQTFGAGTQDNVDTFGGQKQALDMALTKLNIYWENEKEEHAVASQNAIECLQKLMEAGAVGEIWDVIQANGSEFRNNYVNLNKMQGRIKVYPDIDQGLPQSPEQIRSTMMQLVEMASKNNPIATNILDIVPNQESFMAVCGTPDMVIPGAAQRAKTQQDLNTLMENDWQVIVDPQTGKEAPQLPVMPDKYIEDFPVLRDTVRLFCQENWDFKKTNPGGWMRVMSYLQMAMDMEAGVAAEEQQRQLHVKMAGMPPPKQPSPQEQQVAALLTQDGARAVQRLQELSEMPPLGKNGSIAAQVSAAKEIEEAALKLQKQMNE